MTAVYAVNIFVNGIKNKDYLPTSENQSSTSFSYLLHPHVLTLTETWLDDTISDSELAISGYHLVRKDRDQNGPLFVADCIPFSIILHHPPAELLVVELHTCVRIDPLC